MFNTRKSVRAAIRMSTRKSSWVRENEKMRVAFFVKGGKRYEEMSGVLFGIGSGGRVVEGVGLFLD